MANVSVNPLAQIWRYFKTIAGIIFRHPITGTTIIPRLPDGRIVLIHRRDDGRWALPGGIIDWGQDLPTTVERELKEETGLDLVRLGRVVGIYSASDRDPRIHSIAICVEAEVDGNFAIQDTLEIDNVRAYTLDEATQFRLSHDHDQHLQDYLAGIVALR